MYFWLFQLNPPTTDQIIYLVAVEPLMPVPDELLPTKVYREGGEGGRAFAAYSMRPKIKMVYITRLQIFDENPNLE
jgi:hypothetical protein